MCVCNRESRDSIEVQKCLHRLEKCKIEYLSRILADYYYTQSHIEPIPSRICRGATHQNPPPGIHTSVPTSHLPKSQAVVGFAILPNVTRTRFSSRFPHHDRIAPSWQSPIPLSEFKAPVWPTSRISGVRQTPPPGTESASQPSTRACSSGAVVHMTSSTHSRTTISKMSESNWASLRGVFGPS